MHVTQPMPDCKLRLGSRLPEDKFVAGSDDLEQERVGNGYTSLPLAWLNLYHFHCTCITLSG